MSDQGSKFSVRHASESDFAGGGLRTFFEYRDLGIGEATGGRVGAHVIRATRPSKTGPSKTGPREEGPRNVGTGRHSHGLEFQMVYVLKGWVKFHYEGEGEIELRPGACVHQPPGIVHELIECSDDCEMLEITLPADFSTAEK